MSTPTVSRFERSDKDIQMSSVFSILEALGLTDKRELEFASGRPTYDGKRMIVSFPAEEGNKTIRCGISREALEDHFQTDGKNPLAAFLANRKAIEQLARRKYLWGELEADGSVLIRTTDLILA